MLEVTLQDTGPATEALIAFLHENGYSPVTKSGFSETGEAVVFYLDTARWKAFRNRLARKIGEISTLFGIPRPALSVRPIKPEVWQNAWKTYARTYRLGRDLIIKPSWRTLRKPPDCPVITIDPQMAFGTGGHASTRLCLRHLIRLHKKAPACLVRVLDVGTGSGILAIAAVQLGANRVEAVDIDPDALAVARENALKNGAAGKIRFYEGSIERASGTYGLILANLRFPLLVPLLEKTAGHLTPSGILVISGLLREQGTAFLEAATDAGLKPVSKRASGDWISFSLVRRRPRA